MNDGETPRILIVEDEAIVAMDLRDQIEHAGYEVVGVAHSGAAALELVDRETEMDLAILDVRLKGDMDGVELGARLRARLGAALVYITANADRALLQHIQENAPGTVLRKPLASGELLRAVEAALSRS